MDYFRFLRAMEAKRIQQVEELRQKYLAKTLAELPPGVWGAIVEHDKILGRGATTLQE